MGFAYASNAATILVGDCLTRLREIHDGSVRTCVTSPPYWGLRDYGEAAQIGLEDSPTAYVARLVEVFRDVRRALAPDGTLWLNLGDSYHSVGAMTGRRDHGNHAESTSNLNGNTRGAVLPGARIVRCDREIAGLKAKDLVGIPWLTALALRADGWYLRSDIIWHKLNPMPESVEDRCTKAHEYVFMMSKSARYHFDANAVAETAGEFRPPRGIGGIGVKTSSIQTSVACSTLGGNGTRSASRNRRSVWSIASQPYAGAHFATMPRALVEPCVLAGSAPGDLVLDPFAGAGTTGLVSLEHGRRFVGIELNPAYAAMAWERIRDVRVLADEQIERALTADPVFGY